MSSRKKEVPPSLSLRPDSVSMHSLLTLSSPIWNPIDIERTFTLLHVPRTSRYAISMALDLVTHSITVQYMFIILYLIFNYVTLYLHF